jgi:hypothetical protein
MVVRRGCDIEMEKNGFKCGYNIRENNVVI